MNTYCNPLPIPDLPSGRFLDPQSPEDNPTGEDYRSLADPSVVYHAGQWILYPSYTLAYLSRDLVTWEKVDIGLPHLRYSPAVTEFQGKWYLCGHSMSELYVSQSPLGPFALAGQLTRPDGRPLRPADPCFLADGDRLYLYYCAKLEKEEPVYGTVGVELDPDKPWQVLTEPVEIHRFEPQRTWQRHGARNQNPRLGWIEGQWAKKIQGRYYLLYSGCGTEFPCYANGIYLSEEGPLCGFRPQSQHDPLSLKPHGLVKGAGHGCLVDGPEDSLWLFYTNLLGYAHPFERRISMDPVKISDNGELFCPDLSEEPRLLPTCPHREAELSLPWLSLCSYQRPTATGFAPGRLPVYACDDSLLTWWQCADEDPAPTLTVPFGDAYTIRALRLIWRDVGMDVAAGILPGPFGYVVEYAPTPQADTWLCLWDGSRNQKDLNVDYRETPAVTAYAARLRILSSPPGISPGVIHFTCFGHAPKEN